MESKRTPLVVVISLVTLVLITISGVATVSVGLPVWLQYSRESFPTVLLIKTLMSCVAPVLAINDILFQRQSGRILAILSLVYSWILILDLVSTYSLRAFLNDASPIAVPIVGSILWLPLLILFLIFNKRLSAYFALGYLP